MPRGDKSSYTDKQKRQAEHIEVGCENRGLTPNQAKARAWATVKRMTGGGKLSGSGRGKKENLAPARKGVVWADARAGAVDVLSRIEFELAELTAVPPAR